MMTSPLRFRLLSLILGVIALSPTAFAGRLDIGTAAPNFRAETSNRTAYTLGSFEGAKVLVVVFTSQTCPVAHAYRERIAAVRAEFGERGVRVVKVSIDRPEMSVGMRIIRGTVRKPTQPEDAADRKTTAAAVEVFDRTGTLTEQFGAEVTPHVFVFDAERKLRYRGAVDDALRKPKTHYLRDAVEALLDGETPPRETSKPFGCSIRLKADWDAEG